jgi:antitoxin (DNA-binding transcriptional repressor) of toxin-antitoxin stability system
MTTITALQLRDNLAKTLEDISNSDEEVFVTYRGKVLVKILAVRSNKIKTKKEKGLEYLMSDEYAQQLKKYKHNLPEFDEKNPAQEKRNIRNSKLSKYV